MASRDGTWSLFSSHGLVLLHIAANPHSTMRAISDALGITERHVARLVADLVEAGMVDIERRGRGRTYVVNRDAPLRHPQLAHISLAPVVDAVQLKVSNSSGS